MAAHHWSVNRTPQTKPTVWNALQIHYKKDRHFNLRNIFAQDPLGPERMTVEGAGLFLDSSKNRITYQALRFLVELAEESGLQARIDAMFPGEIVNITEKRPALNVALRAPRGTSISVDGRNVVPQVHAVLGGMAHFCGRVINGEWRGYTGKQIRSVINIGIGGSHLGRHVKVRSGLNLYDPSRAPYLSTRYAVALNHARS